MKEHKTGFICQCGDKHWFGAGKGDESGGVDISIICGCGRYITFCLIDGLSVVSRIKEDDTVKSFAQSMQMDCGTPIQELIKDKTMKQSDKEQLTTLLNKLYAENKEWLNVYRKGTDFYNAKKKNVNRIKEFALWFNVELEEN